MLKYKTMLNCKVMSFFPISVSDMRNEKDYLNQCNEILHILDFEILF